MKSALLALTALVAACSIQHRSDEYACTKQSDCNSGRTCVAGFCVTQGTSDIDARIDGPKNMGSDGGNGCPPGCSMCNPSQHTCTIDCRSTDCTGPVTCPVGYHCDINCDADNSCTNGINCTGGLSCNVTCASSGSCRNVSCGLGPCDINCSGPNTCRGVSCSSSCACDVQCTGQGACTQGVQCTSLACKIGLGCTSVPATCHSC
jgi:hypothetical protein